MSYNRLIRKSLHQYLLFRSPSINRIIFTHNSRYFNIRPHLRVCQLVCLMLLIQFVNVVFSIFNNVRVVYFSGTALGYIHLLNDRLGWIVKMLRLDRRSMLFQLLVLTVQLLNLIYQILNPHFVLILLLLIQTMVKLRHRLCLLQLLSQLLKLTIQFYYLLVILFLRLPSPSNPILLRTLRQSIKHTLKPNLAFLYLHPLSIKIRVYDIFRILPSHLPDDFTPIHLTLYLCHRFLLLHKLRSHHRFVSGRSKILRKDSHDIGLQFGLLCFVVDRRIEFVYNRLELLLIKTQLLDVGIIVLVRHRLALLVYIRHYLLAPLQRHLVKVVPGIVLSLSVKISQLLHQSRYHRADNLDQQLLLLATLCRIVNHKLPHRIQEPFLMIKTVQLLLYFWLVLGRLQHVLYCVRYQLQKSQRTISFLHEFGQANKIFYVVMLFPYFLKQVIFFKKRLYLYYLLQLTFLLTIQQLSFQLLQLLQKTEIELMISVYSIQVVRQQLFVIVQMPKQHRTVRVNQQNLPIYSPIPEQLIQKKVQLRICVTFKMKSNKNFHLSQKIVQLAPVLYINYHKMVKQQRLENLISLLTKIPFLQNGEVENEAIKTYLRTMIKQVSNQIQSIILFVNIGNWVRLDYVENVNDQVSIIGRNYLQQGLIYQMRIWLRQEQEKKFSLFL